MKRYLVISALLCLAAVPGLWPPSMPAPEGAVPIPPSPQREGDAAAGRRYIIEGDYVNSGLPLSVYRLAFGRDRRNFLAREGRSTDLRHDFNVVRAANGAVIAVPNCLQCHAQLIGDSLIVGLGNSLADFTPRKGYDPSVGGSLLRALLWAAPRKRAAAEELLRVSAGIGRGILTEARGVNPADRLTALLITHRDPNTLQWSDTPSARLPEQVVPTDVPAWWLLKKKNAMFYNGFGRGDFGRFLMGAVLLTVNDTVHANRVDAHMGDVLAYIRSLKPPAYPGPVDARLAAEGRTVFERNCSGCHGTYGEGGSYPNLLIPQRIIGTDSLINHSNYQQSDMVAWFNSSWFARGSHPARLDPFEGFVAPPLDGVWVTAPYLHNGSVPDLEGLLDSRRRPTVWRRDFKDPAYDLQRLGWRHEALTPAAAVKGDYDTRRPGYGNGGHRFGDRLDDRGRRAVIEYLKTL